MQATWSVELSEASVALYGLMIVRRMGYKRIHLEGDALNVITAIKNQVQGLSLIHLVYDCCFEVIAFFDFVMFSYVLIAGNTVTHMVAR